MPEKRDVTALTFLCGGCNVREPWEHRCHHAECPCEDCDGRECECAECRDEPR